MLMASLIDIHPTSYLSLQKFSCHCSSRQYILFTSTSPMSYFVHIISAFKLLKPALTELLKNDPLRMAGATAFFTIFALPPILIIIIQAFSLFVDPENMSDQLFAQLSDDIGAATSVQLVNTFKAIRSLAANWPVIIVGFIFLLFVATTLFKVMQSAINQIWKIKVEGKQRMMKKLNNRFHAIVVIILAGILFIIGILAEAGLAYLGKFMMKYIPAASKYFDTGLGYLLSILLVTFWFTLLFRFLPNGKPEWRVAFAGGLLTSILFNIGKLVLRFCLHKSNLNSFYGASGSIVLLMLFVFYTSLIIYYGAAYTKIWGIKHGMPIKPRHGAMQYQLSKVEE
jgi:membrane protein